MNKIIILLLLIFGISEFCNCKHCHPDFEKHWEIYGNNDSNINITQACENFKKTDIRICEHNKKYNSGDVTYTMAHNTFSHLSDEEKQKLVNQIKIQPDNENKDDSAEKRNAGSTIPNSCDWTSIMNPIETQQNCGDCYAFAAVATLEAAYSIQSKKNVILSKQQATDCSIGSPYYNHCCNGGDPGKVLKYAATCGIETQSTYPFIGTNQSCLHTNCGHGSSSKPIYKPVSYTTAMNSGAANIRTRVSSIGPQFACIDAEDDFFYYSDGIFTSTTCNSNNIVNHAITIVGYVYNATSISDSYWIIRNSWDTWWGMNGYAKLQMGSNMCSIEHYVGSPSGNVAVLTA